MDDAGWAAEVLAAIKDDCWMTKLLVTRGIVTKLRWQLEALTERMQKLERWTPSRIVRTFARRAWQR